VVILSFVFMMSWLRKILIAAPLARAFDCSAAAIQSRLPANASVEEVRYQGPNSTFEVPAENVGFPVSPTQLPELCAVQVRVASSASSSFGFGLFLPERWNGRFLAVGNSGFAGGINWLDSK
jgi:feruloyl esterase